jgi:hypothetical protein
MDFGARRTEWLDHLHARFRISKEHISFALKLKMELRGGYVFDADLDPLVIGHRHFEVRAVLLPEPHQDGLELCGQ